MSSIVNFARRHKKKLIFMVVFFGGGYIGIKYLIRRLKEMILFPPSSSSKEYMIMRKHEHYLTIKETSDEAILELVRSMLEQVKQSLSSDHLLEQLKQKPPNKIEIWEKMKILCVSRCLTTIYALSILTLLVKVELNVIGAYLFLSNTMDNFPLDKQQPDESGSKQDFVLSPSVQQKYLENIENFVRRGLPRLMERIQYTCEQSLKEVNLKENINMEILNEKFQEICKKIEKSNNQYFINEYVLNDLNKEICIKNSNKMSFKTDEEILAELNLETFDILNSNDFQLTLSSLIEYLTNEFLNNLTTLMFQTIMPDQINQTERVTISLPFAKMIPLLDKSQLFFHSDEIFIHRMLDDARLNIFSANIYEAFSYVPNDQTNEQLDISKFSNSKLFGINTNSILSSVI